MNNSFFIDVIKYILKSDISPRAIHALGLHIPRRFVDTSGVLTYTVFIRPAAWRMITQKHEEVIS